jgi:hypothetical protein
MGRFVEKRPCLKMPRQSRAGLCDWGPQGKARLERKARQEHVE